MTRQRKIDIDQAAREYIYDQGNPPVSLTSLAERYGVARNTIAEPAVRDHWYERRKEFRTNLGMKVTEAMGEEFIKVEAAYRNKVIALGLAYLAQYEKALAEGDVKMSTRDMIGVAAMLRTLTQDAAATIPVDGEQVVDPEDTDLQPDDYRRALDTLRQLEAGSDDSDDAPEAEAAGTPRSRTH